MTQNRYKVAPARVRKTHVSQGIRITSRGLPKGIPRGIPKSQKKKKRKTKCVSEAHGVLTATSWPQKVAYGGSEDSKHV